MIDRHLRDEELLKLDMTTELSSLQESLNFFLTEIDFLSRLIFGINANNEELLQEKLVEIKKSNQYHIKAFFEFQHKLEDMRECDELQCEIEYVTEHQVLKRNFDAHVKEFRKVKDFVYKNISEAFLKQA